MREADVLVDGLATNLFIVLAIEGQVPAQHEVSYDAEGPAVHALVVGLLQ